MVRPIGAPTREHSGAPTREHSGAPGVVSTGLRTHVDCRCTHDGGASVQMSKSDSGHVFGGDCSCNAVLLQLSRNLPRKRAWKAAQISKTSKMEDC